MDDDAVEQEILDLWRMGGEVALTDLFGIPFDDLMVYAEGTPSEVINEAAGHPVVRSRYYMQSTLLWMLRREGEAVELVRLVSDVFTVESMSGRFGPEARIVAPGNEGAVELVDPQAI